MKTKQLLKLATVLAFSSLGSASQVWAHPDSQAASVDPVLNALSNPNEGFVRPMSRINVLTGAFVELDLLVAELKVMPYVELRFNRRK